MNLFTSTFMVLAAVSFHAQAAPPAVQVLSAQNGPGRVARAILAPLRDAVISTGSLEVQTVKVSEVALSSPSLLARAVEVSFVRWLEEENLYLREAPFQVRDRALSNKELARALHFLEQVNDYAPGTEKNWLPEALGYVQATLHRLGFAAESTRVLTLDALHEGEDETRQLRGILVLDTATGLGLELLMVQGSM